MNEKLVQEVIEIEKTAREVYDTAVKQVRETLALHHRFDPRDKRAVRMNDSVEVTGMLAGITGGLQLVLVFIGTLTLMIGGVGVMNIMLVSVNERTREIGVRKAVGARRSQILLQFLLEALAITVTGGVVGMLMSPESGNLSPRQSRATGTTDPSVAASGSAPLGVAWE